jgi:hypothetical protein
MSSIMFRQYFALFLTSLAGFLLALLLVLYLESLPVDPVIVSYGPFEIDKETQVVKPGGLVCYHIHYFKRLDIAGDISKQLTITPKDGGEKVSCPLIDSAGHLALGDIKRKSCVKIPDWVPDGEGVITLSATYNMGNKPPSRNIAYTKPFTIRKD